MFESRATEPSYVYELYDIDPYYWSPAGKVDIPIEQTATGRLQVISDAVIIDDHDFTSDLSIILNPLCSNHLGHRLFAFETTIARWPAFPTSKRRETNPRL